MFFKKSIENRLETKLKSIKPLAGGDINKVYLLQGSESNFILKSNQSQKFPEMFEKEARGLELMSKTGVRTPKVIDHYTEKGNQFLILEYFESERPVEAFWSYFAISLSSLHKQTSDYFGLNEHNFIGSLIQRNDPCESWEDFFIRMRLKPQIKMAFDNGLLERSDLKLFEGFFRKFSILVPEVEPSLLHGDLWSGNLMCAKGQVPVFIDPAVYYGHYEMDLAMTQMFGGFDSSFFAVYKENFKLIQGWEERIQIHNLYPNLVHLNLFGSSYLNGIQRVLKKYA
ncbi:fructosamine kinase family protein [Lutimonas zeaxanthinifaciens]|uniref:fructosamine kinase family protein n=1 Tax=Lutimonas zeaxanthinifaciens TaxID=3060215 RepID=UPI00265D1F54|nr:fructosamine kinase family protein [Lutimonas sp. YSD2104]WKK65970.1 fructosamine kinase family protein [Lutimonas sp. YSD2104]